MPGTTIINRPIDMRDQSPAVQDSFRALTGGFPSSGRPARGAISPPMLRPPTTPTPSPTLAQNPYAALIGGRSQPLGAPPLPGPPPAARPAAATPSNPADDIGHMQALLARQHLSPRALQLLAHAEDHAAHALGVLLQKPGPITAADVARTIRIAEQGGPFMKAAGQRFAAALPPLSDQNALRSAIMKQRERSINAAVAIHAVAKAQGVNLTGGRA